MAIERHECKDGAFHTIQGILECGHCNAVLADIPTMQSLDDNKEPILVCPSCGSEFHPDELADARVEEMLERLNKDPDKLAKQVRILREALGELLDPPQGTDIRDRITKGRFALEATKEGN